MLISLTPQEQTSPEIATPFSTTTFYSGVPPLAFLRERVLSILSANAWLCGRLVTTGCGSATALRVDDAAQIELDAYFTVFSSDDGGDLSLSADESPAAIARKVARFPAVKKIGNRSKSIRNNSPLFNITVAANKALNQFALVTTIHHVIADGFTFYRIFNMLHPDSAVVSLDPVRRNLEYENAISKIVPDTRAIFFSPIFILRMLITTVKVALQNIFFGRPNWPTPVIRAIDPKWIADQKLLSPKVCSTLTNLGIKPFVSTNDILTAWFFRVRRANIGLMIVNLRDRVPELTDYMAGNMESAVMYASPRDMYTPSAIRASIGHGQNHPCRSGGRPLSSPILSLPSLGTHLQIAAVTNWAGFYRDVVLPGSVLLYHQPVVLWFNDAPPSIRICIIFSPKQGRISIATNAVEIVDSEKDSGVFLC